MEALAGALAHGRVLSALLRSACPAPVWLATRWQDGVVDADCRVFGTRNLYVVSSAVFPSAGQANPTLTILALSARIASHLADQA